MLVNKLPLLITLFFLIGKISAQQPSNPKEKRYNLGQKMSINMQDSDIRNVLELIAELTGLNIVISPEVQDTVTANLSDVSVKAALDAILQPNGYSYFIKENIDKWKKINYSKSNLNLVFLIGFPRSGTTLLDTILRSHPKIKIIEEKPLVTTMISKIKNKNLKSLENITNDEINFLRQEYQKEFEKYENPENKDIVYIDKLPLNIIYCGEILRIFPDAKFILSLRHPLDSVLSCFMQDFVLNNAMANFLRIDDATKLYENIFLFWLKAYIEEYFL